MKINQVSIVIENADESNATVKLITDPIPHEDEEIEDTPCVLLGSALWEVVQEFLENVENDVGYSSTGTLQ